LPHRTVEVTGLRRFPQRTQRKKSLIRLWHGEVQRTLHLIGNTQAAPAGTTSTQRANLRPDH
jgi:hypothetical protein